MIIVGYFRCNARNPVHQLDSRYANHRIPLIVWKFKLVTGSSKIISVLDKGITHLHLCEHTGT